MYIFISEFVSSVIQIIIFSLIPFVWWLITARKETKFLNWIGLKWDKEKRQTKTFVWIISTIVGFWVVGTFSLYALKDVSTATTAFSNSGLAAIPAIVIYALFHTALSEEILFRGFLLKRISNKFGFHVGNCVQALLFGLLHGALFISEAGYIKSILLTAFTAAVAWTMGYINEKKVDGSIYPSWIIHGVTNIISGICAAF